MWKPLAVLVMLPLQSAMAEQSWIVMEGAEIKERLTGQTLQYTGASQKFYASGKTLYDAGAPSWGNWRVEADAYCSQWPPGESWDCYKMDRNADGSILRFLDAEGRPFVGHLVE